MNDLKGEIPGRVQGGCCAGREAGLASTSHVPGGDAGRPAHPRRARGVGNEAAGGAELGGPVGSVAGEVLTIR